MEAIKGLGLKIAAGDFNPIRPFHGGRSLWDPSYKDLILSPDLSNLNRFLPDVMTQDDGSVLMKLYQDGAERAGTSKPARAGQIPASEITALNEAFEAIKAQASNEAADPDKRRLIALLELPDPERLPELYRLYGPFWNRRLLVVWGGVPASAPASASIRADLAAHRLAFAPLAAASMFRGPGAQTGTEDGDQGQDQAGPSRPAPPNNRRLIGLAAIAAIVLLLALLALWFLTRPSEDGADPTRPAAQQSSDPQAADQSPSERDGEARNERAGGDGRTAPERNDQSGETSGADNQGEQPGSDPARSSDSGSDPDRSPATDGRALEADPQGQGAPSGSGTGAAPGPQGGGQVLPDGPEPGPQGSPPEDPARDGGAPTGSLPTEPGTGAGADQPAGPGQPNGANDPSQTGPSPQPADGRPETGLPPSQGPQGTNEPSAGQPQGPDQHGGGDAAASWPPPERPQPPVRPDISQGRVSTLPDGRAEIELFAAPPRGNTQTLNGRWSLGENSDGAELVGAATGQVRLRALPRDEPYQVIYTDGTVSRVVDVNIRVNATTEDR